MKVEKHPNECPYINRIKPDFSFNEPIEYDDKNGTYIFYDRDDGFGVISRVQYCQFKGRKRDVFECLNESEWKNCHAYQANRGG